MNEKYIIDQYRSLAEQYAYRSNWDNTSTRKLDKIE